MPNGLNLSWPFNPISLLVIIVLILGYILGGLRARRSPILDNQDRTLKWYRVLSFVIAIVVMALVLLTPLDTIGRTQLFSMHMAQAVALTTICTPLFLLATPAWLLQPFLDLPVIRPIVRTLARPLLASLIFNAVFLLWLAPGLLNRAQSNPTLYQVELLSIWFASLLNWWPLIGSVDEFRHMNYPMQMLYAFLDGQPVDIFAFLLVFSGAVFYTHYAIPSSLGLSPFGDQAAGGALLLLPGLVDLLVMSPLFFRWLAEVEQRTRLNDERLQAEAEAEAARQGVELS